MNQSLEMDYCDLRNHHVPEMDRQFEGGYSLPLFKSLNKHFVLFTTLEFKQKMLFIYSEIFEILVMHNVITKSCPLFNSIWPYVPELSPSVQIDLMKMMLLLFLYVMYRMIFYTRDLLVALITSIFVFFNNNDMGLESCPIEDFESNDSNDSNAIDDQPIDEEEGEYEADDEDNVGNCEDNVGNGEDNDSDWEDIDDDGEDNDSDWEDIDDDSEDTDDDGEDTDSDWEDIDDDSEDTDGDSEDTDGDSEDTDGNGELRRRGHFQNDRMNPSFYHSYPAYTHYPVYNYTPSFAFHIPDIHSYSSDEFYSANELHEADEESESDFSVYSLDGANQYYQYEDNRHGDVFGNHIGNI